MNLFWEIVMSLASRFFMFTYAAAMAAVAAGLYAQHNGDYLWPLTAAIAFFYFILAVGYTVSRDRERAPAPVWLVIAFVSLLLLFAQLSLVLLSPDRPELKELRPLLMVAPVVLSYLVLAMFMLRDFRLKETHYRLRQILVPLALVAGAALVFSSLPLMINLNQASGWNVLLRRADWITSHINVGTPLFTGNEIKWLQPIYAPGGYIIYLLALLATVAILLWVAVGRISIDRPRNSSLLTLPAVIICIASLWVTTDIFWGWHFELSATRWAAVLATVLWLAGPLFGAVVIAPLLWKRRETWRLRAFLLLQAPIAAFNLLQLPAYFGSDSLNIDGLGTLIIGLQLESLACLDLLALRAKKDLALVNSGVNTSRGDSRSSHEAPKERSA
jgi:hypothetical protein